MAAHAAGQDPSSQANRNGSIELKCATCVGFGPCEPTARSSLSCSCVCVRYIEMRLLVPSSEFIDAMAHAHAHTMLMLIA